MVYELEGTADQLKGKFYALQKPEHIAELLEVDYSSFNYWLYRVPSQKRYTTFQIKKKSGGVRRIDAPTTNVKILQQKLNQVLRHVYQPKPSVHGFIVGRNVRSNAELHVGKRWILNVDLENFFPSVNFGRVQGMLAGKPYYLPKKVATVLAHLCCFQRRLPQGAPTSPVISNMICAQMDSQLQQLAGRHRCTYSRYADDITFSTTRPRFPSSIAAPDVFSNIRPGSDLKNVICKNGFAINEKKVGLRGRHNRQHVTGITVNDFPNVTRKFTNQIRAMLHAWKTHGLCAAQAHFENSYDKKHRAPWNQYSAFSLVVKGKIEYLGMIKGKESMTYLRFLDQLRDLAPELAGPRGTPLRLLLERFRNLMQSSDNPQERGYKFEKLLDDLFKLFEIPVTEGFVRNDGAEQIDFAFRLDTHDLLAEAKWRKSKSSPSELDSFTMKVNRSGENTRGVFISVNGWSVNVVNTLKKNPTKNIFLVDGDDVLSILTGSISLVDVLRSKANELSITAEPFISADDILQRLST